MQRIGSKVWVLCFICLIVAAQSVAQEKNDFQKGKIVSVKQMPPNRGIEPASNAAGSSDAPLADRQNNYTVSVQLADKIYDLRVESMTSELQKLLVEGQSVDVKIGGKTAQMKDSLGRVTEFPVLGSHPAS
jgi:hypothetical protein